MSIPRSIALPALARPITLDTRFGPVAALRADPPDGDTPRGTVLLLPGFTGSKEDFLALLEPLAVAGFTVVAVDQRGQYETVGPEDDDPVAYSLDAFAREAVAIGRQLVGADGALHLVGHSFGGLVARDAALLEPSLVRSLTLLCSGPGALPASQHADLGLFVSGLPLVGKTTAWSMMRDRNAAARGDATPEVEDFVMRRFVASSTGSLVGMARILGSAPDRVEELVACGVPVQVAHGATDDAWPLEQQAAMAQRLGGTVAVIADAGHSPNVDQPEATAALLAAFFSSSDI
jgi:pimeloyl-ACP methyl ester carboxylesterase